eukprot:g4970.t1
MVFRGLTADDIPDLEASLHDALKQYLHLDMLYFRGKIVPHGVQAIFGINANSNSAKDHSVGALKGLTNRSGGMRKDFLQYLKEHAPTGSKPGARARKIIIAVAFACDFPVIERYSNGAITDAVASTIPNAITDDYGGSIAYEEYLVSVSFAVRSIITIAIPITRFLITNCWISITKPGGTSTITIAATVAVPRSFFAIVVQPVAITRGACQHQTFVSFPEQE